MLRLSCLHDEKATDLCKSLAFGDSTRRGVTLNKFKMADCSSSSSSSSSSSCHRRSQEFILWCCWAMKGPEPQRCSERKSKKFGAILDSWRLLPQCRVATPGVVIVVVVVVVL